MLPLDDILSGGQINLVQGSLLVLPGVNVSIKVYQPLSLLPASAHPLPKTTRFYQEVDLLKYSVITFAWNKGYGSTITNWRNQTSYLKVDLLAVHKGEVRKFPFCSQA